MRGLTPHLHQTATVWTTTPNAFGGYNFAEPYTIKCRWEDRTELYYGRMSGKEEVSRAAIFVEEDLSVGDWIVLGDYTDVVDPSTIAGALPVRDFSSSPDLRNMIRVRKARV
jgi:hypothetical protein